MTMTPTELAVELWGTRGGLLAASGRAQGALHRPRGVPGDAPGTGGEWHLTPKQVQTIRVRAMGGRLD